MPENSAYLATDFSELSLPARAVGHVAEVVSRASVIPPLGRLIVGPARFRHEPWRIARTVRETITSDGSPEGWVDAVEPEDEIKPRPPILPIPLPSLYRDSTEFRISPDRLRKIDEQYRDGVVIACDFGGGAVLSSALTKLTRRRRSGKDTTELKELLRAEGKFAMRNGNGPLRIAIGGIAMDGVLHIVPGLERTGIPPIPARDYEGLTY